MNYLDEPQAAELLKWLKEFQKTPASLKMRETFNEHARKQAASKYKSETAARRDRGRK